jgi:MoaA/NifB/PqqE/SkfB family radical SAM enzyme
MVKILCHFRCKFCHSEFWLPTRPGEVSCPNPQCEHVWAPHTAVGLLDRGDLIEVQILDVLPSYQPPKD